MTLVHEFDELMAQDFKEAVSRGQDEKPAEKQASANVADDPLALVGLSSTATSLHFSHGQVEALLSRKGGMAQLETFLRDLAMAADHQRLGKNIRASLEAELGKLQRMGKVSLSSGIIRLL